MDGVGCRSAGKATYHPDSGHTFGKGYHISPRRSPSTGARIKRTSALEGLPAWEEFDRQKYRGCWLPVRPDRAAFAACSRQGAAAGSLTAPAILKFSLSW